jgi:hypothetical protein
MVLTENELSPFPTRRHYRNREAREEKWRTTCECELCTQTWVGFGPGEQASRRTFGETVKQSCHFMKINSQIKYVFKTRDYTFTRIQR